MGTAFDRATVTPRPNPSLPGICTDAVSVTPSGPPPVDTPIVGRAPPGSRLGIKAVMGATHPVGSVGSGSTFVTVEEAVPPSVWVTTVVTRAGTTPSTG